ncbi:809_t:CDS:2 [Funneliformis caledonium]|uniref:809_t:CDS:1 n=1 Tax=Funneliformis caledonium TaxID=1117310 RepID=A0A9N9C714_9GLOM|nr:809_t:CDS:2 [Funneliformis caledonium]
MSSLVGGSVILYPVAGRRSSSKNNAAEESSHAKPGLFVVLNVLAVGAVWVDKFLI